MTDASPSPKDKKRRVLLAVTAAILPCMFFFFLVNQNQEYLPLVPCLLVGGAFAVLSLLAYAILTWVFRARLVVFTVLVPAWTMFFTYGTLYTALSMRTLPDWAKLLLLLSLFVGAHIVLSLLLRRLKSQKPLTFVSLIVVFVFAFNLVSVIGAGVALEISKRELLQEQRAEWNIKTDFLVDENAPRPDIYWFHMDGMMSVENVLKYFGDPQEELQDALHARGFTLNESAYLNAGLTCVAIPALMCPGYYDSRLREKLEKYAEWTNIRKLKDDIAVSPQDDRARQNNELLHAFAAAGYEVNTIASGGVSFFPMHRYYQLLIDGPPQLIEREVDAEHWKYIRDYQREAEIQALADLLEKATMLPQIYIDTSRTIDFPATRPVIAKYFEGQGNQLVDMERAILDILQHRAPPKFVVIMNMATHVPFVADENADEIPREKKADIDGYLPNQKYGDKIMLEMIDFILESDPEAVIVLQADHGVHTAILEENMRARGFTDGQIVEIQNGVFSAVRIPSQYGNIPEELLPLDPRNIARLLVNRFVGENYPYLH